MFSTEKSCSPLIEFPRHRFSVLRSQRNYRRLARLVRRGWKLVQGDKAMKVATLTSVAVLLGASCAFAGGGAPVPEGSQTPDPSGRPSAVLDDAKCESVWKMASPNGDTLSQDKAVPYVVNF